MGASCEKGEDRSVVLKETWIILDHLPVVRIQDTQRLQTSVMLVLTLEYQRDVG